MDFVVALLVGYLLGSIPTGPWLGRLAGVDVQRQGSRNSGATNVARTVGKRAGLATLVGDALKGVVAVWFAGSIGNGEWVSAAAGLTAILGHSFSIFLRFTGGKGVATALGVFLALAPWAAAMSVVVFFVTAFTIGYVSLAALLAATSLPLAAYALGYSDPVWQSATLAAVFVLLRHHENVRRLLAGNEPKFRSRA